MIMKQNLEQQRCPKDDALAKLGQVAVIRNQFEQPMSLRFRWLCQECHDTFETTMTYLEILKLD